MAGFASLSYLVLIIPFVTSLSFNFDSFNRNDQNLTYEADAYSENGVIQLTKNGSVIPDKHFAAGEGLGLASDNRQYSWKNHHFVAVEFDIFTNSYDPRGDHVGVDINSMQSAATVTWFSSIPNGTKTDAWISYNSISKNLSVVFTGFQKQGSSTVTVLQNLSYNLDLREYLPEWVTCGFSGATGAFFALQTIYSWNFTSPLKYNDNIIDPDVPLPSPVPDRDIPLQSPVPEDTSSKNKSGLVIGLISGGCVSIAVSVFILFAFWRKRKVREDDDMIYGSMTNEFQRSTGPKKFLYSELVRCTNNFSREEMFGQGGFGGVYKGYLRESNSYIDVKKVSRESKQGIKEAVGRDFRIWLDSFGLRLEEEEEYGRWGWGTCVVHRDIKSSNIMLDSNFNAKLGDFGLARLVDHDKGSQTTVLAGMMGYMARESVTTGKASKETDVYSFGVVALEIACGRKPIDPKAEEHQVNIVDWVWRLYGMGNLHEAVDPRLSSEFNEEEVVHLLIVGLWCAHPDNNYRPSIRQAIQVLNFEAPLPTLPPNMFVPTYCSTSQYGPTTSFAVRHNMVIPCGNSSIVWC
ncbi:hypothetical protein H5410_051763 [Solanum commersonii]|uniref:Protein kinase domain-containing protein n=1 Tax=Solanum commersonii TaxID=4109 RepID=A0A9J5X1Z3_SOLCO|nr:hypothetical protein H5410_051763 [Solanum commersonii]